MSKTIALEHCVQILDNLRKPINSDERYFRSGDIPYYGANGQQGWIDDFLFDENLVLLAEDGGDFDNYHTKPIAYRVSGKSWVNNHAHVLKATPEVLDNDYLYWALVHKNIVKFVSGGTRSKLNQSELRKIEIPYFSIEKQKNISRVLNTIESQIDLTKDLISKLNNKKRGLSNDLLTRGVDSHGNFRPSYEDAPDLYQDTELGFIPKEWEIVKLDEISEKVTDGTHQAVTTIPLNQEGVPFLFVSCVKEGKILWNKAGKISRKDYQELSKGREPSKGMIIYTVVGSYGDAAGLEDDREVAFQRNTACIYPNIKLISSNFLVAYLNSESVRKHADRVALGNAQKLITLGELKKYLVVRPPLQEQKLIEEKLKVVSENISFEKENLDKLTLIKTGLLKSLLQN